MALAYLAPTGLQDDTVLGQAAPARTAPAGEAAGPQPSPAWTGHIQGLTESGV